MPHDCTDAGVAVRCRLSRAMLVPAAPLVACYSRGRNTAEASGWTVSVLVLEALLAPDATDYRTLTTASRDSIKLPSISPPPHTAEASSYNYYGKHDLCCSTCSHPRRRWQRLLKRPPRRHQR